MNRIGSLLPTMVIGFIQGNDVRILDMQSDSISLQSCSPVQDGCTLTISFFDVKKYGYDEFIIKDCKILDIITDEFSYFYKLKAGIFINKSQ